MYHFHRKNFLLYSFFVVAFGIAVKTQNLCSTDKLFLQINPVNRVIFRFQCTSGNTQDPIIPLQASIPVEFNELDLSPNLFTSVPISQICQFANLYLLDLSYNSITNTSGAFARLGTCLTQLAQLDLSHNLIATPLLSSDFSDDMAARLVSLNFAYNFISSIDSAVFYKADGSARFPNLSFLSFAYNRLYAIDLLWPMTMSNANLKVELNQNQISTLVNPLGLNYGSNKFIPMTGNRYVDLRNNSITNLTDSNLLQYGLQSADDFRNFLFKISNYDLRGTQLSCVCPSDTGLYTVYWFSQFANSTLNSFALIYQLSCANLNESGVYIFNFTCKFVGTTVSPTSANPTTVAGVTTNSITTVQQQTSSAANAAMSSNVTQTTVVANSVGQLVGDSSSSTSTSTTTTSSNRSLLGLLALLVIPVVVALTLGFMLLCGRCCLTLLFDWCSVSLCLCFRPDGSSTSKPNEAVVCYNEHDESWLEQRFLPFFDDMCASGGQREKKRSRVARLKRLGGETTTAISQADIDTMRSSKRIILIVTKKFLEEEWKNKAFRDTLSEINRTDAYCSIIVINLSEVDTKELERIAREIELGRDAKPSFPARIKYRIANHVKYNCGVRDVEYLDWHVSNFWAKLAYLMPRARPSGSEKLKAPPVSKSKQSSMKYGGRTVRGKTDSPEPIIEKMEEGSNSNNSNSSNAGDVGVNANNVDGIRESTESTVESGDSKDKTLITKIKRISDAKRVTPVTTTPQNLTTTIPTHDMSSRREERDFWSSLKAANSDLKYEPVSLAGSAVSGNREANLNRFGMPISMVDTKSIYSAVPHRSPRLLSTDESVKTVTSTSASSVSKYSRKRLGVNRNESDSPIPINERILIPPEFIPKSFEPQTEELEIRETQNGNRDVRKKRPSKPKVEDKEEKAPETTKKPPVDIYDELLEQVFEETEIKKPRKILNTIESNNLSKKKSSMSKFINADNNDYNIENELDSGAIKKPKKKVVISNDIRKYNLSTPEDDIEYIEQNQDGDILAELDEYMGTSSSKKKKSNGKKRPRNKKPTTSSEEKVAKNKKDDDDFKFDFDID